MDKILIYNLNPYIIRSSLVHLIKKLSKKNKVYLITSNDTLTLKNYNYFQNLEKSKILSELIIIPSFWNHVGLYNILKFILFFRNSKLKFDFNKYDLVLFCYGHNEIDNFFLNDHYMKKNIIQYLPFHSNKFLFENYNLCKKFFKKNDLIKINFFNKKNKNKRNINFIFQHSFGEIIQKTLDKFCYRGYINICLKIIYFLFKKKNILKEKKDLFIRYNFSNRTFLNCICFNEVQKKIGEKLYSQNKFHVATPVYFKSKSKNKNFRNDNLLLLIGWFAGENNVIQELINNIKYLLRKYNITNIYIKAHPSFDNEKIFVLSKLIKKIGVKTIIIKSSEVVTEMQNKFKIIAGFASHALVEAKYSFPNSKIICLDKVDILSNKFQNPPARIALGSILKSNNQLIFLSELINKKKISINNKSIYKSELFLINKFLKNKK